MIRVIKRNGSPVNFDMDKIVTAINKAFVEVTKEKSKDAPMIASQAVSNLLPIGFLSNVEEDVTLHVEDIQDQVENVLMDFDTNVAKAYIRYREIHKAARNQYNELLAIVEEKLKGENVQNQNANMDEHSFGGRVGEAANAVMKQYALNYCMSEMTKMNHLDNLVYVHDLDRFAVGMHNCLTLPLDKLLANGFNTRQTDVRPANSVGTAFQLVAVLFQLQSLQQFGGVSASHLDWTMVPYVRKSFHKHYVDGMNYIEGSDDFKNSTTYKACFEGKDIAEISIESYDYQADFFPEAYKYAMDMTKRELKQAVEGMYHNLNTLQSRSGNQLPFTSINYGTCTLTEGRMVTEALLNGSINGVGKLHKTSIFPCGIFQCMKGVNRKPGDPNYDLFKLAIKSTSIRLYPNYANVDWSGNAGYDVNDPKTYFSTMGVFNTTAHFKPLELFCLTGVA